MATFGPPVDPVPSADATLVLTSAKARASTPAAPLDPSTKVLVSSFDTTALMLSGRVAPIRQGIEVSTDNGQTWVELANVVHGNPPAIDRHTGLPFTTHTMFVSIAADAPALYRSFVDPQGVAIDTTVSIAKIAAQVGPADVEKV